tara:strand:- start:297 stop:1100 length:804 start_codon:yes stop_codon:yes gene_type:complete
MVKIRTKELSPEMIRLTKPHQGFEGRSSIGMDEKIGEYYYISIQNIIPYKKQARKNFDLENLDELAETIKIHGVRQPLSVIISDEEGFYEVISGERRLRAAKLANLNRVPCIIIKDENNVELISLIENIQREDLHPIELGNAYASILEKKEWGGTTELALEIGKPISSISEGVKLSKLPLYIQEHLIKKNIRSKALFRSLINTNDDDKRRKILGLDTKNSIILKKSVFRVCFDSKKFFLESKQVEKLTYDQKIELKKKLIEFAEKII